MDLIEGINTRRSSRAFKPTPVPRELIEKILVTAGRSPSYTNTQPWEVIVVSGKKKEELGKILYKLGMSDAIRSPDIPMPETWPPELDRRSREHTARRYEAIGVEREDKQKRKMLALRNYEFYDAPCGIFLFMDKTLTPWSIFDMGVFAQSILLAAHSFGLGTCLQMMLAVYPDAVRDFLGVPKEKKLVIGMSLGYPDMEARINSYRSQRIELDKFVHWEAWYKAPTS